LGSHQDGHAHGLAGGHAVAGPAAESLAGAVDAAFLRLHCDGRAAQATARGPSGVSVFGGHSRPQRGRDIEAAVERTPEMGLGTEIIFVEGHSKDNTWEEIQRVTAKYPQRRIKTLKQQSKGKGGAVREAFAAATGDILFILDADLTMPPEELPKFYEVARSGTAEFVNGVRLVYPMEEEAMQFLNMIANKAFGMTFSWLLDRTSRTRFVAPRSCSAPITRPSRATAPTCDFDPFGDFDLIFGAAKLNLRMVDLPIRYRARTYGETNIHRWSHGWLLLRMVLFAARRMKFLK